MKKFDTTDIMILGIVSVIAVMGVIFLILGLS